MPLFGHHDEDQLREAETPSASTGPGQRIRVAAVERDNGLTTATSQSISSALYDLADANSLTHTVSLPHGTTVKLAAATTPRLGIGSYRARFEISNPAISKKVEAVGTQAAADLANQIDVLAMGKADKDALTKVAEEEHLEEIETHVSGYVTRSGRHVGAYSQIRKSIDKLGPGSSVHFPDGISVKRTTNGYTVGSTKAPQIGGISQPSAKGAADYVAKKSAMSTHPKSIGGRVASPVDKPTDINAIPNSGDNPKLPGTPHPRDVADRAAKALKAAKLPSRKERARNEAIAGTKTKLEGLKSGETHEVGTSTVKRTETKVPGRADGGAVRAKGGHPIFEVTGPGGTGTFNTANSGHAAEHAHARSERATNPQGSRGGPSPMPGVIRTPNEADAIRASERRKAQDASSFAKEDKIAAFKVMHGRPPSPKELAVLDKSEKKDKSAAATIDREKRKRAKTVAKHPAAKARRQYKGLSEGAGSPGLIGR